MEKVKDLFCNEEGFQTPKLDTRAAIFKDNRILLVKEKKRHLVVTRRLGGRKPDHKVEHDKRSKRRSRLDVEATRIIAVQDTGTCIICLPYAYNVCKVFVLCEAKGGDFQPNIETIESGYFSLDEIPR